MCNTNTKVGITNVEPEVKRSTPVEFEFELELELELELDP